MLNTDFKYFLMYIFQIICSAIWTAAVKNLPHAGSAYKSQCRSSDIISDAAYGILTKPAKQFTGNFCHDEDFLRQEGVTDFDRYRVTENSKL